MTHRQPSRLPPKPIRECEVCGNELPDGAFTCPYCDSRQSGGHRPAASGEPVRTVNVEAGLPTVEEGLARLESELWRAIGDGVRVVRVIHGWGSTGTGGKLRTACRVYLAKHEKSRQVKRTVPGEAYSKSTTAGQELLKRCPSLKDSLRTDTTNPGITFVVL